MERKKEILIPVVLGTAREGRKSEAAAKYMVRRVKELGVHSVLIDVREYATCETYEPERDTPVTESWRETMEQSDGLVVVAPEYNHGYPGELKIVLDSLYGEYDRKPVAVCGVSSGMLGGARVVEQLRGVFVGLGMVPTKHAIYFSRAGKSAEGQEAEDFGEYDARSEKLIAELLWYAKVLKKAREEEA